MRKGRSLEAIVATIEKQMSSDPDVIIESPKRVIDSSTGRQREHDVILTVNRSHHTLIVAIECKDLSRPVAGPVVEAFYTKCKHTNINQGIIVSSSGFYKSAITKAEKLGIRCIALNDIERTSWLAPDASVVVFSKKLLTARYSAVPASNPDRDINDYDIFDQSGNLVTEDAIKQNMARIAQSLPEGGLGKVSTVALFFHTDGFYLKAPDDEKKFPIKGISVHTTYVTEVHESSFRSRSYVDTAGESVLAELATAVIELNGEKKEVLITDSADKNKLRLIIK